MVEFNNEKEQLGKNMPDEFYLQMKEDKTTGEITISAEKKGVVTWLKANVLARDSFKLAKIAKVLETNAKLTLTDVQIASVQEKIKNYQHSNNFQKLSAQDQSLISHLSRAILPHAELNRQIQKYLNNLDIRAILDQAFVSKGAFTLSDYKSELFTKPIVDEQHKQIAQTIGIPTLNTPEEGDDLINILKTFVAEQLGLKESDFTIELVQGGLTTGITGVPVYLIKDKDGTLLSVLKQYPNATDFEKEGANRANMARFQGEAFLVPDHLACAKCPQGSSGETYWILQSAAQGKSVSSYFETAGTETGLEDLKKCLSASARGLAALHSSSQVPAVDLASNTQREQRIMQMKANFEAGASVAESLYPLNREFLNRLQNIDLTSANGCLTHGDFQPGNVFVDSDNAYMPTFIDLDLVTDSIDQTATQTDPKYIGFPAYDLANFSLWIAVEGHRNGLTQEQILDLRHEFESAYMDKMHMSDEDKETFGQQFLYMSAYICMERLPQVQPGGRFHDQLGPELSHALSSILLSELEQLQGGPTIVEEKTLVFANNLNIDERIKEIVGMLIKV